LDFVPADQERPAGADIDEKSVELGRSHD